MISIIIPTRNKAPRLLLTLAGLVSQKDTNDREIIIVNDGCEDDTKAIVQQMSECLPLRMIPGVKRGRASSRNQGAKYAKGDLLVFLDDDILTTPMFISEHLRYQTKIPGLVHGRLREMIGITRVADPCDGGPGAPPMDIHAIMETGFDPDGFRLAANALERTVELMFQGDLPNVSPWLAGAGANISLPKKCWQEANGFDESFGSTWGCEDLEFAYRLFQKEVPISFAPEAFGVHLSHERRNRWKEHEDNFKRFAALYPTPEVTYLPILLEGKEDPKTYVLKVTENK